jgi:glycosyltransferase involved in cell wall biosynthesis
MIPELTIGLSIYNPGAFLEPALQSIFAQTFQDWELILVDDGSDDGSTELLSSIRDPRVRVLRSGPRLGLAARLNHIVQASRGHYFARMDADDMLDKRRLEMQVSYLRDHTDVDLVGSGLIILDNLGKPTGMRLFDTDHASICKDALAAVQLEHSSVVGRTEWFRKHPYNEKNRSCEDWELWFKSYETSRFANLREPLYYYREFASFSIGKYVDGKLRIARLQWARRADFGLLRTSRDCLGQYLRIAVYILADLAGFKDHLIRRRSKPIDDDTRAHVLAATEETLNLALPLTRRIGSVSPKLIPQTGNVSSYSR